MINTSTPAIVAAALHQVFASSRHAPDSLEMWLAVTAEATRQFTAPAEPGVPAPWVPVFAVYRNQRTDARYHPATAAVLITTGPLTGITYTDAVSAARAVTTAYPGTDNDDTVGPVPTWRLSTDHGPDPHAQPRVAATC
ncbi:hypothetical protein [Nocardia anaemiae]|uniref:hypothetical protein n=1 Tax=Nocardia anaemiae TaxID=263910 RepID=UPI0007A46331|nr:hypothetical protein [Nocardia anaemiae]